MFSHNKNYREMILWQETTAEKTVTNVHTKKSLTVSAANTVREIFGRATANSRNVATTKDMKTVQLAVITPPAAYCEVKTVFQKNELKELNRKTKRINA